MEFLYLRRTHNEEQLGLQAGPALVLASAYDNQPAYLPTHSICKEKAIKGASLLPGFWPSSISAHHDDFVGMLKLQTYW